MGAKFNKLCDTRMKLPFNFVMLTFLCALVVYGQQTPCGIGAFLVITHRTEGDRLQIVGVASNSPAARAGLASGQVICTIDGVPTMGLKLADCVRRIQGEAGTKVVLKVEDRRRGWTNSVELTREIVPGDPLSFGADAFEIPQAQKHKSLSVTTNQVVRVSGTNGAIAIIQFTQFGATNANYRWRFRPTPGGIVSTGAGVVFEDYNGHIDAYGMKQLTHRGSPDDLKVKAGDVRLEWSSSSLTSGWLYYYPSREKVEVLDSSVFDSNLVWSKNLSTANLTEELKRDKPQSKGIK
jgi:membrane-associated protease RseP (regulator of RpoE activity)